MGRAASSLSTRGRGVAANDTERRSASRLDPLIGTVINGRFHIHRVIARGGMGRVYYATQEPLGRPVALKVVRDDPGAGATQPNERFLVEADILARLQHPNIVTIHDFGEIGGAHRGQSFIAMEFLPGETLAARLERGPRLRPAQVLSTTLQIVRGLRAAHDRGIVHRDLKPSNILLLPDTDGEEIVKLVDFGIGKLLWASGGDPGLTEEGSVIGTPQFMAPEQFEGRTSSAVDLYAVGVIMFLCLSGRLPFDSPTTDETVRSKIARAAPRLREVVPDLHISERLDSLIGTLLARAPDERPSALALVREIETCQRELVPPIPERAGRSAPAATVLERSTAASIVPLAPAVGVATAPGVVPPTGEAAEPRRRIADRAQIVIGLLAVYAIVLVYVFGRGESPRRAEPAVVVESAAHAPSPATAAPGAGGAAPAPGADTSSFTLVVESIPPGATVSEDGRLLGTTPVDVLIEHASVGVAPRQLLVHKSGYSAVRVEQGPSREDARVIVALARAASPSVRARRVTEPSPSSVGPPTPAPSVHVFSTAQ